MECSVTLIELASQLITPILVQTPCVLSPELSERTGAQVYLKLDLFQKTGSFKERGALNCLLHLNEKQKTLGVVTASAGNHAQAVAMHATRLGISSRIFMPVTTPNIKVMRTTRFGAVVELIGENYDEAVGAAQAYAQAHGCYYVHAYDDPYVIAGQGTIGFEICEQVPQIDVIVVAIGGGGLIGGIAMAAKSRRPSVRLIGVEPKELPSMQAAIKAKKPVILPSVSILADGVRVRQAGHLTLPMCQAFVDDYCEVADSEVAHAIGFLLQEQKILTEGAGAIPAAACLNGKIGDLAGKNVCLVIGGGNLDPNLLCHLVERQLVETGQEVRIYVRMPDRPGELSKALAIIAQAGSNVIEIRHERAFGLGSWSEVLVSITLQTRGIEHSEKVLAALTQHGYKHGLLDAPKGS